MLQERSNPHTMSRGHYISLNIRYLQNRCNTNTPCTDPCMGFGPWGAAVLSYALAHSKWVAVLDDIEARRCARSLSLTIMTDLLDHLHDGCNCSLGLFNHDVVTALVCDKMLAVSR